MITGCSPETAVFLPLIGDFLREKLKLELHPDKVFIKTLASGVDFLGWVHFPDHRVLRTATKKRMIRRIKETEGKEGVVQSYLGMLGHGNAYDIRERIAGHVADTKSMPPPLYYGNIAG